MEIIPGFLIFFGKPGITSIKYAHSQKIGKPGITSIKYLLLSEDWEDWNNLHQVLLIVRSLESLE
jgi:hypothetical protein